MDQEAITRREFLKKLGRLAGLGALGGIAAAIGLKNAAAPAAPAASAGETCRNEGWCRPCPVSADCGLPRALSFRAGGGPGKEG